MTSTGGVRFNLDCGGLAYGLFNSKNVGFWCLIFRFRTLNLFLRFEAVGLRVSGLWVIGITLAVAG